MTKYVKQKRSLLARKKPRLMRWPNLRQRRLRSRRLPPAGQGTRGNAALTIRMISYFGGFACRSQYISLVPNTSLSFSLSLSHFRGAWDRTYVTTAARGPGACGFHFASYLHTRQCPALVCPPPLPPPFRAHPPCLPPCAPGWLPGIQASSHQRGGGHNAFQPCGASRFRHRTRRPGPLRHSDLEVKMTLRPSQQVPVVVQLHGGVSGLLQDRVGTDLLVCRWVPCLVRTRVPPPESSPQ